jgi:hypothetical protein
MDRMPRMPSDRHATTIIDPGNLAADPDLAEAASLFVMDAPNLYRDIVQGLKKGADWLGQKALFVSDH